MMAKRWSKRDEQKLLRGVGAFSIDWFLVNVGDSYTQEDWPGAEGGRTRAAIYAKAFRLYGRGGLMRGAYSLRHLMRMSGYSLTQLERARKALGQKWRRTAADGNYIIHEEQAFEMLDWLRKDYWVKKHRLYNCVWCHTREIPHRGKGLCIKCYQNYVGRLRRRGFTLDTSVLLRMVQANAWLFPARKVRKAESELKRGRALPEKMFNALLGIDGNERG